MKEKAIAIYWALRQWCPWPLNDTEHLWEEWRWKRFLWTPAVILSILLGRRRSYFGAPDAVVNVSGWGYIESHPPSMESTSSWKMLILGKKITYDIVVDGS